MRATVQELNVKHWESDQKHWKRKFRPSLEKLRRAQLRDGSLYSNLRTCVPVPVLSAVWLWVIHWNPASDYHQLLERSVTVSHLLLACGVVGFWNLWLALSLYERRSPRKDVLAELLRLAAASCASSLLLLIGNLVRGRLDQGTFLAGLTAFGLFTVSFGLLGMFLIGAMFSTRLLRTRGVVIVGSGKRAALLRACLESHYSPFMLYGCVDDEYVGHDVESDAYLGKIDALESLLKAHPIEIVLIGLPMKSKYDEMQRVIRICEAVGVEAQYMRDIFETSDARVRAHSQEPDQFTVWSRQSPNPKQVLKRMTDLIGATILLILFCPIMLAAAVVVRLSSPGPILFVQQRYGRNRKRFPMFKFRSMVFDAEKRQAALEDRNEAQGPVFKLRIDPRVTRIGGFLRRTSIDELPQLFNVLRGEMSLVGPRPLPLRDVSRFKEAWLLRRFSVRPGLTCLWQVNGRSDTSFAEWIKQDLKYIDQWSLGLDLKILMLTIPAVLRGSGAV